jgi:hypothetical protein
MQKLNINKKMAPAIMGSFATEVDITGQSAFSVMQALTRFGQTQNPQTWVEMDEKAGVIAQMNVSRWGNVLAIANSLQTADLQKIGVLSA